MQELRRRFVFSLIFIAFIITVGSAGYMVIEGWNCLDSLYMTIITIASVGYKEIHDLSPNGRIFTIILIIGGVGSVAYALTTVAKIILEGEIREIFGRKRMEKRIKGLRNHYIICGYGRMGKIICKELKERDIMTVIVEQKPEVFEERADILLLEADATKDEVLREAGIEKAKGLISVLPSDAENLFVVLSARELNPNLFIVARAGEEGSEQKLIRAGADRVVSPYHIGGLRIAHTVLKPAVVDFIEFATKSGNIDLQMEEISVPDGSKLSGLTLDECGMGRELGIIIVAIKKTTGDMKFNPTFRTTIKPGDTLIALGEISKLKILEDMAKTRV